MKKFVKTLENLPWIVKLILVIFYGVYGNLYRLARSIAKDNVLGIILACILLLLGGFILLWIYDIVCIIIGKDIWWID